jgi:nucleoside 2-deoxyribosyltransferase
MYDQDKAKALFQKMAEEAVEELAELLFSKAEDYGTSDLQRNGPYGVASRLVEKSHRLTNLLQSGDDPNHESLVGNAGDIANYGLIMKLLLDGAWEGVKLAYLAGPIDAEDVATAMGWRGTTTDYLLKLGGWAVFNPMTAYGIKTIDKDISAKVSTINRAAIAQSDLVIVNLATVARALGTIREIEYARSLGIRVMAYGPDLGKHIEAHDIEVYDDLMAVLEKLSDG